MNKIVKINDASSPDDFDKSIFQNINWSYDFFRDHKEIAAKLKDKNPYTITVLIENLNSEYWRKKEYGKITRIEMETKYKELLYEMFFRDSGDINESNQIYGIWIDKYKKTWKKNKKYQDVDDLIVEKELEPKYKTAIFEKHKNIDKLFAKRYGLNFDRYYHLPVPLNYIDWRTPYDNLFVWSDNGKKYATKGGSGSSGARETNSKFIFGFLKINQTWHIPSYLFIYTDENKLKFIKKFDSLCVPEYDIGSNYFLDNEERNKNRKGGIFLSWKDFSKIKEICVEQK